MRESDAGETSSAVSMPKDSSTALAVRLTAGRSGGAMRCLTRRARSWCGARVGVVRAALRVELGESARVLLVQALELGLRSAQLGETLDEEPLGRLLVPAAHEAARARRERGAARRTLAAGVRGREQEEQRER